MFKLFKVIYNDGGWHNGALPYFFYIAKSKEEVIENSERYKRFLEYKENRGGVICISEVSGPIVDFDFENLKDFEITINVKVKEKEQNHEADRQN